MDAKLVSFAILMLLTGSVNTIATKFQDTTVVGHTHHGHELTFKHPAVQSACMFAGEFCCLLLYVAMHWRKKAAVSASLVEGIVDEPDTQRHSIRTVLAFALPAMCDAAATTLLNLGLFFTFASTYQMLRGTLVLWAGLLTIVILKRQLHSHHWLGMVLITAGAALVGASSVIFDRVDPSHHPPHKTHHPHEINPQLLMSAAGTTLASPYQSAAAPLLGDIFVVLAQLFAATQFIVEEKFLKGYRVPALLAVGLEGLWGLALSAVALPALTYIKGTDGLPLDDAVGAWHEIAANRQLQASIIASIVSIAFFNFFGVTVTKKLSGAARATIDACRTLFVWMFSVLVHWERFHSLQVVGFVVLLSGTSIYNELLKSCLPSDSERRRRQALQEPLLGDAALTWQHQAPSAAVPVPGWGRPPLPPGRTRGPGSSYTMARSVRMPPGAFSPHSMASALGFGQGYESVPSAADVMQYSDTTFAPSSAQGQPDGGSPAASLPLSQPTSGLPSPITTPQDTSLLN